ncbi:MAG: response regulator [bacterium]|nr:response regulator [bacterium]
MNAQKIALIEDDKILSNALYEGLKQEGFEVLRAFDGEEGFSLVEREKPLLVLLNILLPKMDGLAVARKIKSNPATKDIPIIILTQMDRLDPVVDAVESGVYDYYVKSDFSVEKIVEIVKNKVKDKLK